MSNTTAAPAQTYCLSAYPLTDDGVFTEGDDHPTQDACYQEMREWMIAENWTYVADPDGGYYALDGTERVYAMLIGPSN